MLIRLEAVLEISELIGQIIIKSYDFFCSFITIYFKMMMLEQMVIRDCIEILSKNKDGLSWIELLIEIKKINTAASTNSLELIILNDLIKNKNIECPTPGYYKIKNNILKAFKREYLLDIVSTP